MRAVLPVVLVIAIAVTAFLLTANPDDSSEASPSTATSGANPESMNESAPEARTVAGEPASGAVETMRTTDQRGSRARPEQPAPEDVDQDAMTTASYDPPSVTEQMQAIASEVAQWTSQDLLNLDQREAQDGATLFKAFRFAASCIGHPTTIEALEARSEEFQRWHRQNPDNFDDEMLERSLTGLEDGLARCGGIEEDYVNLAFDLLARSVERGYLPAQIAIVNEGRSLLFRDQEYVFRHPEKLMMYRSLAEAALASALSQRIPEALELQAEVMYRGYFAPPDRITGLAYALASKEALSGISVSAVAEQIEADARLELSPDDMDQARRLSRQICETLC